MKKHLMSTNQHLKLQPAGVPECDCWLRLPDEVWLSILSVLPHSDLCRVAQACRRLHKLATDHTLWKKLRIENSTLSDWWLLCVGRRRPHSLCLYSCSSLSAASCGLEMFFSLCRNSLETCPGLQHLNIGQVPKINSHSFTVMASQLKYLISLNLTGLQAVTNVTVETLLQSCTNLQSLTLSSCPGVTDQTLHNISKYTPGIRSLDVSGCNAVTDAGIQPLAVGCRRLHKLDVSSTDTGNRGVTLLANYCGVDLHTVKLSFCHISSESILKLCRRCKRLKVLHLYGCAQLPTEQEIREVNTNVKVCPLP
ncbi:hypothetical protein PAMP_022683 [Pampus punctatissimus]